MQKTLRTLPKLCSPEPVLEVGVPATAARFTNQTLTCAYRGGEGVARLEWLLDGAPFFQ